MTALRVLTDLARPARRAPTLLVLLPGALQTPETLLEEGVAAAVRARGLAVDMALVDPGLATIGEATDGSVAARLESLLAPARRDYRSLWLAGVSLGRLYPDAPDLADAGTGGCLLKLLGVEAWRVKWADFSVALGDPSTIGRSSGSASST